MSLARISRNFPSDKINFLLVVSLALVFKYCQVNCALRGNYVKPLGHPETLQESSFLSGFLLYFKILTSKWFLRNSSILWKACAICRIDRSLIYLEFFLCVVLRIFPWHFTLIHLAFLDRHYLVTVTFLLRCEILFANTLIFWHSYLWKASVCNFLLLSMQSLYHV